MDLNLAMLTVARALPPGDDLAERVRLGVLELLATGFPPAGLSSDEQAALIEWAATQKGDELYQEMLRREMAHTEEGVVVRVERGHHRRSGAYYTTEAVVRYMVDRARELQPLAESLIDPACGAGAFLQGGGEAFPHARLSGWDLDPVALALCRAKLPVAELTMRDALLDQGAEGAYDLCLGNPPYISSGLRGAVTQRPERQRALRERYPHSAEYKLNTYPLFIERGLELLRPGGVLGYILPDSFLTGRYFAGLRRLLLRYTLLELTLIQQDFWAHGRVGQSVILFVRKEPPAPGHQVRVRICQEPAEMLTGPAADVPLADLVWGALDRFRLVPDSESREALRHMETGRQSLGRWIRSYSGLIGRRGQATLLAPSEAEADVEIGAPVGRLLRSGREIDRYRLQWAGAHVHLDPALIKSGGNRAYYEGPKILLRQTADSLRAVYDDMGYYCLNNIHLLVPARPDANLRALLGLINSAPFGRFYRAVAMEDGRLYAQVDLDLLESLPVPALSPGAEARLEALVRARESAAPEGTAPLEAEIDLLVEQLYRLG